jgi:hypothetical protein
MSGAGGSQPNAGAPGSPGLGSMAERRASRSSLVPWPGGCYVLTRQDAPESGASTYALRPDHGGRGPDGLYGPYAVGEPPVNIALALIAALSFHFVGYLLKGRNSDPGVTNAALGKEVCAALRKQASCIALQARRTSSTLWPCILAARGKAGPAADEKPRVRERMRRLVS